MSKSFEELISKANQKTLKKVSVSNAQDEPVLQAVKAAKEQNIATAILVGDEAKIRSEERRVGKECRSRDHQ